MIIKAKARIRGAHLSLIGQYKDQKTGWNMNNVKGRFYPQIAPKGCYLPNGQLQAVILRRDIS